RRRTPPAALTDALTCAAVLGTLASRARSLAPPLLEEARSYATVIGPAAEQFFADALASSVRHAWSGDLLPTLPPAPNPPATPHAALDAASALGMDGPLARSLE